MLLTLSEGAAFAVDDSAVRCQRAIERPGLRYADALIRSASDCALHGEGPLDACLDARLGEKKLARLRARWEAGFGRACATTNLDADLGYFPACRGGPSACEALAGGIACLECRVEQHVRTAVTALYANAPESNPCHAALGRVGVETLATLLHQLGACLRRRDAVSIAACLAGGGLGERLDAALAAWRAGAVAACGTTDPFTALGYPTLCSGVPPEPINSCSLPAPACTLPAATRLGGEGADDDLLDCLDCRVEETALAVGRELFGANLCSMGQGEHLVRTRTSCRRAGGTPVYFENRPFTVVTPWQPYFAHGLDVAADGSLYVAGDSVVRVPDPSGTSAAADLLWMPNVFPTGAAVDAAGDLYVASRCENRIWKVTSAGVVTVVAGTGVPGHSGDGGPATAAEIVGVNRVSVDAAGNVFFTESGIAGLYCGHLVSSAEYVRMIDAGGVMHTVAGSGIGGTSGEGGPALAARLLTPFTLRVVSDGGLLVGEYLPNRAIHIDAGGTVTRVVGRYSNGPGGFSGDGGPALRARFHRIEGLRPGPSGELYIGDAESHRVRFVDRLGSVITIAGTGELAPDVDFAAGPLSPIGFPAEVAVHPDGRVFFSDTCTNYDRFLRVLVPVPF
jgi:hypothetical protein